VTESSRRHEFPATLTAVATERNRLMSWDNTVQGLAIQSDLIPNSKSSITLKRLDFVCTIIRAIFASLSKLPYTLFKIIYEIMKLFTRGLLSIRRSLFAVKFQGKKHPGAITIYRNKEE